LFLKSGRRGEAASELASLTPEHLSDTEAFAASRLAVRLGECTLAIRFALASACRGPQVPARVIPAAGVLAEVGRLDEALALIEPVARRHGSDPSINHFLGTLHQQLGAQDRAEVHLLEALAAAESSGITWLTLAAQHRFQGGDDDPLFRRLTALRPAFAHLEPARRVPYLFALGKALLDTGDADGAFDAFAEGGRLNPESAHYDPVRHEHRVAGLIEGSGPDALARIGGHPQHRTRAIFVLGLPRSGTTLLHRILAANEAVSDGGEFAGMGVATMDLRRRGLEAVTALVNASAEERATALEEVAGVYAHLLDERFGPEGRIVDKGIANIQLAAVITTVFPSAPLILLERNPLDVAWSCFRTCFNNGQAWSWTLDTIASHLQTTSRLAAHWKQVLGDRLIRVSYEELVRHPEVVIPALCSACGIDYDGSMLAFHHRPGGVQTSSVAQVREPLNDASIGSAQAVAHRLGPVLDAFPAAVSGNTGA
jgi:hypothetical protein